MIEYREFDSSYLGDIKRIYESLSWSAYLKDDEKQKRAFDSSLLCLGAFEYGELIGLIRCVGDGEHILLVQDLAVDKEHRRRGIGTRLFTCVLDLYRDVRIFAVMTDLEDELDNKFYSSFGLVKSTEKGIVCYIR